nr:hypothetical protein [Tanacetum cinerariifolium]
MSIACDVIACVRYCWTHVPSSFHAFFPFRGRLVLPRRFLVLVEIDLLSFIRTTDPTKGRIGERERDEDEPKLLETTVGRVVPLLAVAPDRSSGELEASVDKLSNEGGSGEQADQGDSASGGHGVGVQLVDVSVETIVEDVAPAELQRQKKRKTKVVDGGEHLHPFKKLRGDYRVPVQHLLDGAVQYAEVRGGVMPTFPFLSSSVSTTPEQAEVDSVVRTSMPIMTGATTATPIADPAAIAKERLGGSSVFGGDSSFAGGSHPISGGFSDRTGSDFLEKRWLKSVVEEKDLLLKSRCDEIKSLKAQLLIKEAEATEAVRLRDEAQALKERNTNLEKEKSELEVKVIDLTASVKVMEQEVTNLDDVVTSASGKVTMYENCMSQVEKFQDKKMKEVNEKFDKLCVDFFDMALHLEEKLYPHLLSTISERRWLPTHSMKLAISKCLNSTEYLSSLRTAIGKAIEKAAIGKAIKKGMQEGLSAGITHGAGGRTLTDVAAYNPSVKADYLSALQRLQSTEGTFGASPDTTTALSVTSISASTIPLISTDDYEIAHTEGGEGAVADVEAVADEGADPFP